MTKTLLMIAGFVSAISLAVLPSCKKDDDKNLAEPPAKDSVVTPAVDSNKIRMARFVGVWRTHEEGEDSNGNGIWDSEERLPVDSANGARFTFNADSSGSILVDALPVTLPFRWSLRQEGRVLWLATTISGVEDVQFLNVVSVTESMCILSDTTASPASFYSLKR